MLTINECQKILNAEEQIYTEEEIILIIEFLNQMVDIELMDGSFMQQEKN